MPCPICTSGVIVTTVTQGAIAIGLIKIKKNKDSKTKKNIKK
tara:strand:- start:512 stop:637 length:126 start_codon:yes stop_codon:yes gene_type:complete